VKERVNVEGAALPQTSSNIAPVAPASPPVKATNP